MPKLDSNELAASAGVDVLRSRIAALTAQAKQESLASIPTVEMLVEKYGRQYRPSVVGGLLRRGETMNIIAPPKSGKSWLAYHLALAVASGGNFMEIENWKCEQGNVVIIDNELHSETIGARLPAVREAMKLPSDIDRMIRVKTLRGEFVDINGLAPFITQIKAVSPQLVILDSLYRFMPAGAGENDVGSMVQIANSLDRYAEELQAALVVIHHSTKGSQADKNIVDIGSGAAMARSTDNHFVLRAHEKENHYVVEARPRSWPWPEPVVCRWEYPLWLSTPEENPKEVLGRKIPRKALALGVLDDASFVTMLGKNWKSSGELAFDISFQLQISHPNAVILVRKIISAHFLEGLLAVDGEKNCGLFLARREGKTTFFKLKGTENGNDT